MKTSKFGQLGGVVTPAVTSGCEHLEEEGNEGHRCRSKKSHQEEKINGGFTQRLRTGGRY